MFDKSRFFIIDFIQMIRSVGQIFKLVLRRASSIVAEGSGAALALTHSSQRSFPREGIPTFEPLSRRVFVPL